MNDEPSTLDVFSFLGTWWIPQEPDNKVSGRLAFDSEEGIKLSLYTAIETGRFDHPSTKQVRLEPAVFGRTFGPPVILGIHDDGTPCTVFGVQKVAEHTGGGPARRVEYRGTAMLMGSHIESPDAHFFKTVHVRLTHLEEWLGDKPFSSEHIGEKVPQEGHRVMYRYPEVVTANVATHGLTVSTCPHLRESFDTADFSIAYKHRNYLTLKSDTPWSLESCLVLLSDVRVLLTMLIDAPVYFDEVIAEGDPVEMAEDQFRPDYQPFYLSQPFRRMRKSLRASEMLFSFADIRDRLGAILTAWLDRTESLRSVYDLMESVFFSARMSPHVGLLTLTQAFETFHRTQIGGDYMDKEKYEKVRAALAQSILADVAEDHREALKTRIKFGNAYSMRKRIDMALKSMGEDAVNAITRNRPDFGKRVADTRNYLTHRDESSKGLVIKEADLATAAEKFRYFFTALLMTIVGIPAKETIDAICRNYQKKQVLDWDGL